MHFRELQIAEIMKYPIDRKQSQYSPEVERMSNDEDDAMKRRYWFLLIFVFCLLAVSMLLFGPKTVVWRREITKGNGLVLRVESFRQQQGHLPESLSEVDADNADLDRFFYQKCSDSHYILWFGTELGESMTYDSLSRSWTDINGSC
jgi:hypothetical protein